MPRLRATLQGWLTMVAFVALALGVVIEWRRRAGVEHGAGYERARAIFAARQARGPAGGYGGDGFRMVLGVAAVAILGTQLRRRFPRAG